MSSDNDAKSPTARFHLLSIHTDPIIGAWMDDGRRGLPFWCALTQRKAELQTAAWPPHPSLGLQLSRPVPQSNAAEMASEPADVVRAGIGGSGRTVTAVLVFLPTVSAGRAVLGSPS